MIVSFVTPFAETRLAASSPGAGARQRPGARKGARPSENQIGFGSDAALFVLPQGAGRSSQADLIAERLSPGIHLRRVRTGLQLDPRRRSHRDSRGCGPEPTAQAAGSKNVPR